jgi:amino acid transporter
VIYLAAVPVQALAVAAAPPEVRDSPTPLVEVLIQDGTPLLAAVLDLGIAASFFACLLASVNALIRVVFCMARVGVAPRRLGTTHHRYRTPTAAAVTTMVVVGVTPVVVLTLGVAPDAALRAFLTLSACGYLGSYLAACVSAPALLRRIGESTPGVWLLSGIATLVLGSLVVYALYSGLREQNWLLVGYLAALVAAMATTVGLKIAAPDRLAAVGIYDQTQDADLLRAVTFR